MDPWHKVGSASNLNLNGKREEITFLACIFRLGQWVELEREMRENLHLLSMIYEDRVVGICRVKI